MPERQGKPWSAEEERELREAFQRGVPLQELARTHQRSVTAIRIRLERPGEPDLESKAAFARPPAADVQPHSMDLLSIRTAVDGLIEALEPLKAALTEGRSFRRALADVVKAYERLNTRLLTTATPAQSEEPDSAELEPVPDRLRAALFNAVVACVSNLKNRHVASLALGLVGDGQHIALAQIGRTMDVTRERIRQRKMRAFRSINASLPRRFATAQQIRTVLNEISATTDWTDPDETASHIVKLINDKYAAATQLTVMCCKAAGASSRELQQKAERAVAKACRDPELHGSWTLDRWTDAASKAIFEDVQFFSAPPDSLKDRKRLTGNFFDPQAPNFRSEKLARMIACESGLESRVLSWLERSPEILWYQEQPTLVPYKIDGMNSNYFPDAAAWDSARRIIIVEAKPIFWMFRRETLIKALAALRHFGPLGMGYLLVDERGRTLAELACQPFDLNAALEVEKILTDEPVSFGTIRSILENRCGRFDWITFGSIVVNRDWAVSSMSPMRVSKLPAGVSFRPLLL